ncbi:unnamed protein product [Paramecium primaurelia]|uniref:Uncharacterized protein n=1 Tax=Paramecium primaurelia TaxID=5886 RepID=A0A8S1QBA9_PARPR|nr:unnamed protein product [Paramecium primaurelia]
MERKILQRCLSFNVQLKIQFEFKADKYYILIEVYGQQYYFKRLLKHQEEIMFNQNELELESVLENLHKMGQVLTYDLCIVPVKFEQFAEQVYYGREGSYNAYYGHIGDGDINYNIVLENVEEMHMEYIKSRREDHYTYKEFEWMYMCGEYGSRLIEMILHASLKGTMKLLSICRS